MKSSETSPAKLRPHPQNPNWTKPRSWGVWELPVDASGKQYRYGNNPVREKELTSEFGKVTCLAIYTDRVAAMAHATRLNHEKEQ